MDYHSRELVISRFICSLASRMSLIVTNYFGNNVDSIYFLPCALYFAGVEEYRARAPPRGVTKWGI